MPRYPLRDRGPPEHLKEYITKIEDRDLTGIDYLI